MCSVDKMLIKGIRSFSPDNTQVIEFYRPLTLIVGQNGAGKTTIIECLKQACTGDLPPNTRAGQSFIHDPKVAGETEVKAQIKLRIATLNGRPVVIIRSFSLTQKKNALQFKALDQSIQTVNRDTNEKEALAYRCADMDRTVPSLMGVSKAVLENVIFVHQEESNWPLSEGQVLKKKFDDIFAATKYTKALDALRKLRLETVQSIKEMKLKSEHLTSLLDQCMRHRSALREGQKEAHTLEADVQQLQQQVQQQEALRAQVESVLGQMQHASHSRRELAAQVQVLAQQNNEMQQRIVATYPEEDREAAVEELEEFLATSESTKNAMERERRQKLQQLDVQRMHQEGSKAELERCIAQHGRLAASAEAHAKNVEERDRFVLEKALQLNIKTPDGALTTAAIHAFANELQNAVVRRSQHLESAKQQHESQEDQLGSELDALQAKLAQANETVRMNEAQVRRNDDSIKQLKTQAQGVHVTQTLLSDAHKAVADAEAEAVAKQHMISQSGLEEQQAGLNRQLQEVRDKITALRQERDRVAVASEGATALRLKRQELNKKKAELQSVAENYIDDIKRVLGVTEPPEFRVLRDRMEELSRRSKQTADNALQQLTVLSTQVENERRRVAEQERVVRTLEQEASQLQTNVKRHVRGTIADGIDLQRQPTLASAISAVEDRIREQRNQFGLIDAAMKIVEHNKHKMQSERCCPTCTRQFRGQMEIQTALHHLDQEAASMPSLREQITRTLGSLDVALAQLRSKQPDELRAQRLLSTEVPSARQQLAQLQEHVARLVDKQADCQGDAAAASAEAHQAQQLLQNAALPIDAIARDIHAQMQQVQQLELQTMNSSSERNVSDVDNELQTQEHKKDSLERDKEQILRRMQLYKDELSALTTALHTRQNELTTMQAKAEKRSALQRQIVALNESNEELRKAVQQANRDTVQLEQQKADQNRKREISRAAARREIEEIEAGLRQVRNIMDQYTNKERTLKEYELTGCEQRLQQTKDKLEALQKRIADGSTAITVLEEQITDLSRRLDDDNAAMAQAQDLLQWRRSQQHQLQLEQRVEEIDQQVAQFGDAKVMQDKLNEFSQTLNDLREQLHKKQGALETVLRNVAVCQQDLNRPEYANIDAQHKRKLVELKTTEMAASDLDKYHKALERALLSFHTTKMADINKIIKELWQKTYRGADIDYIQIKADADGARSYNYRVVMSSNGAELEMRGRCSAGQKVLACLVIRLALAETFCINCGILALDEPTTNLDYVNSKSLAQALRGIMLARREHQNFQLIVITHDEQFANLIGTREHADFRWRITKDTNGHSHLEQEVIE